MKIAIASGKGGTGKTTVAVNLALAAAAESAPVAYVDCDVEEPNGHLFLQPTIMNAANCALPVPRIDEQRCTGCGRCARLCQYGAIVRLGKKVLVFPELCHGCGGCTIVCSPRAITEEPRHIGVVERGITACGPFVHGRLEVGQAMSPPLIRAVLKEAGGGSGDRRIIVDAPPGTSCPAVTAMARADYVVLVTEPTPFGLSDLALALATVAELRLPAGVVVNRHGEGNDLARQFCSQRGVRILAELPDDRRVAEAYSRGVPAFETIGGYADRMRALWRTLCQAVDEAQGSAA
ncbi:MAG: P-loop NTPase [Chitinivibrionales bacterium]|nr:P-loop NTPase [Chitinivibrionales bacterium]